MFCFVRDVVATPLISGLKTGKRSIYGVTELLHGKARGEGPTRAGCDPLFRLGLALPVGWVKIGGRPVNPQRLCIWLSQVGGTT